MDDGAFWAGRGRLGKTVLVAVLLEGARIVDLRLAPIQLDGVDGLQVLLKLLKQLAYDVVMLSGISFGGFNLIDIKELASTISKPAIAVVREKPNNRAVRDALRKHFDDWRRRWANVQHAAPLYSCKPVPDEPGLYFEVKGTSPSTARRIIMGSSFVSRLPEPVRVAGILAKGVRVSSISLP